MILTCTIKLGLGIFNNIQSDNISDENAKRYRRIAEFGPLKLLASARPHFSIGLLTLGGLLKPL